MTWAPPPKNGWQIRAGANGTWLVRCLHGNEKTRHGDRHAHTLWAVSRGHLPMKGTR